MAVYLPDEMELRKILSPRTISWLLQISQIAAIQTQIEEIEANGLGLFDVPAALAAPDNGLSLDPVAPWSAPAEVQPPTIAPGHVTAGAGLTGGGNAGNNIALAVGAGTGITVNDDNIATTVETDSGTYTPTLTMETNMDAATAYECQYLRVGSVALVSGRVDVNPTAAGGAFFGMSLPIASNFANQNECGGTGNFAGIASDGLAIYADTTNDRARFQWIASNTTSQGVWFSFTYRILA